MRATFGIRKFFLKQKPTIKINSEFFVDFSQKFLLYSTSALSKRMNTNSGSNQSKSTFKPHICAWLHLHFACTYPVISSLCVAFCSWCSLWVWVALPSSHISSSIWIVCDWSGIIVGQTFYAWFQPCAHFPYNTRAVRFDVCLRWHRWLMEIAFAFVAPKPPIQT